MRQYVVMIEGVKIEEMWAPRGKSLVGETRAKAIEEK